MKPLAFIPLDSVTCSTLLVSQQNEETLTQGSSGVDLCPWEEDNVDEVGKGGEGEWRWRVLQEAHRLPRAWQF